MEPPLWAARLHPVPVRRAPRGRGDGARRSRAAQQGAGCVVPGGSQTLRRGRAEATSRSRRRAGRSRWTCPWGPRARRPARRSRRAGRVGRTGASTSPRTDACAPRRWRRCTRDSQAGWRSGRASIPKGCSARTWRCRVGLDTGRRHDTQGGSVIDATGMPQTAVVIGGGSQIAVHPAAACRPAPFCRCARRQGRGRPSGDRHRAARPRRGARTHVVSRRRRDRPSWRLRREGRLRARLGGHAVDRRRRSRHVRPRRGRRERCLPRSRHQLRGARRARSLRRHLARPGDRSDSGPFLRRRRSRQEGKLRLRRRQSGHRRLRPRTR